MDIDYIPREYVLPDGRTLEMMQRHVWCGTCKTIRPAEALGEDELTRRMRVEAAERHRRELRFNVFKHPSDRELREKWLQDLIEHEQSLLAWQAIRRGPAACLKCRSKDIALPATVWADLPHGGCDGTLEATATIIGGAFRRRRPHQYTPEGELLAIGARNVEEIGEYREEPLELWWNEDAAK